MSIPVDVIVKFQGAFTAREMNASDVFPDPMLIPFGARQDRALVRIGMWTTTIRQQSAGMVADFVQRVKAAPAGDERGRVLLYGSSSGGRNVIDLAIALTREQVPLAYVGVCDAAWFPDETLNRPDNFFGEPTVIPQFAAGPVAAAEKVNFFQTLGNHSEVTLFHGLMFTSGMGGKEVHGNVVDFTGQDLTAAVRAFNPASDDDAHVHLTRVATPLVHSRMLQILLSP
jgi:hypothetical protein